MKKTIHNLKIDLEYADAVYKGMKTAEIRNNDRNFQEGDIIVFTVVGDEKHKLNGLDYNIDFILEDDRYLQHGYVMLCIAPVLI